MRILCLLVVLCAGCSGSVTVKPDPWAEYATAQQIWEHEFQQNQRLTQIVESNPSDSMKDALERSNADLKMAADHLKETRKRLPVSQ